MEINPSFISSPHVVWVDNPLKESKITRLIKALLRALAFPIAPLLPKHFSEKLQPKYHGAIQKSFPDIFSLIRKYGSFQNIQRRIEQGKPVIELLEAFEGKSVSEAILIPDPQERKALEQTETYLREFRQIVKRFEPGGMDHHTVRTNIYVKDQALFDNPKAIIEKFTAFQKNVITKPLCEWSEKEVEYFELRYFGKIIDFEIEKKFPVNIDNLPPLYQAWIRSIKATPSFYKQRGMHNNLPSVHRELNLLANDWKHLKERKDRLVEHPTVIDLKEFGDDLPIELYKGAKNPGLKERFFFLKDLAEILQIPNDFCEMDRYSLRAFQQLDAVLERGAKTFADFALLVQHSNLLTFCLEKITEKEELPENLKKYLSQEFQEKFEIAKRLYIDKPLPEKFFGRAFHEYLKEKPWIYQEKSNKRISDTFLDRITLYDDREAWDQLSSDQFGKMISQAILDHCLKKIRIHPEPYYIEDLFGMLLSETQPIASIIRRIKEHNRGNFSEKLSTRELHLIQTLEKSQIESRWVLSDEAREAFAEWKGRFLENHQENGVRICFIQNTPNIKEIKAWNQGNFPPDLSLGKKMVMTALRVLGVFSLILKYLPYRHVNFLSTHVEEKKICKGTRLLKLVEFRKVGVMHKGMYNAEISGHLSAGIQQYAIDPEALMPDRLLPKEKIIFSEQFYNRLYTIFQDHKNYSLIYPGRWQFMTRFVQLNSFFAKSPKKEILQPGQKEKRSVLCSQFVALALLDAADSAYEKVGRKLESMEPLGFHKGENLEAMHPVKLRNKLLKKKIIQKVPDPRKKVLEDWHN